MNRIRVPWLGLCAMVALIGTVAPAASTAQSRIVPTPFSFRLGGDSSDEFIALWRHEARDERTTDGLTLRIESWRDPVGGLEVTRTVKQYPVRGATAGASESVMRFENHGSMPTAILSDILPLDLREPHPTRGLVTVHHARGSTAQASDFEPQSHALGTTETLTLAAFGGRSSDGALPFFDVERLSAGRPAHTLIAIGWTGQWQATFARAGEALRISAGMERTHLRLMPGESIRTPAILMMVPDGEGSSARNDFRRLLLRHFTPRVGGVLPEPMIAVSPHGLIGFNDSTEANMLGTIELARRAGWPVNTFWIDAGWYDDNGTGKWESTGTWAPNPRRYPRGLAPIGRAAHLAGLKFLLWFEPERVMPNSELARRAPDWLLRPAGCPPEVRYMESDGFSLLDLGNPEARAWILERVSALIRESGVDIYRNDFNMYPLYCWRNGEPEDRQGMREIRYVEGLYAYFDALRQRFPKLVIDNCASGGRRIDFEMLRRAFVFTRTDHLWFSDSAQDMTMWLNAWLPITGLGAVSTEAYDQRSGWGYHYVQAIASQDPEAHERAAAGLRELRPLQRLLIGDFYPLTTGRIGEPWAAWQVHRGELSEGLVQAFRREGATSSSLTVRLKGLQPDADYEWFNLDHPDARRVVSGRVLAQQGMAITIPRRPGSAVIHYQRR